MNIINFKLFIIGLWQLYAISANPNPTPSIVDIVKEQANLTKFTEWITTDPLISVVVVVSQCTIFAPTDEAFKKYFSTTGKYLSDKNFASLHTTGTVALPEVFPQKVASFDSAAPNLFLLKKVIDRSTVYHNQIDTEYYVNNAKIIGKPKIFETSEKKQVLYIIDEIITPYERRPIPPSAYDAIAEANSYAKISNTDAIKQLQQQILKFQLADTYKRAGFNTYFVPINIDSKALPLIDDSVLRGHIIPDQALFLRTMDTEKPYKSLSYDAKAKVELSLITKYMNDSINTVYHYVQSNTIHSKDERQMGIVKVKIHRANVPVTNGVIHFIERPLMIVTDSIKDILAIEGPGQLSIFSQYINKNEELQTRLSGTSLTTLLAPTDEAFRRVDHIIRNMTYNDIMNIVRLHFIADQSISSESVKDTNKEFLSLSVNNNDQKPVHFTSYIKDDHHIMTVEGDGVNASVLQADIGAINGIVHIIDKVLGVSVQTIKEKLASDPRLRTTYEVSDLSSGNWNNRLDDADGKFTVFAPSAEAWEKMRTSMPSEHKQLTQGLYPQNSERIVERHIVVGKILVSDDLKENKEIETARGSIIIKKDALNRLIVKWENIEALITRANVQSINGVIHEIDRVLMKKKDLAVSPALALNNNNSGSSLSMTVFSVILMIILVKLF